MSDHTPQSYWHDALMAFGRMSGWVVGPIVVSLFLGKWLDAKFGTWPIIFVALTGIAFILSMFGLVKEGKSYLRSVEEKAGKNTHGTNPRDDN
ncbi:MAG: AtpZ/AtpI family protein [bacterium]